MADRWVNAVVEFTIALEVSPDAPEYEKREAMVDYFEEHFAETANEHVATMRAETVEDGEPVEVDPAVRLDALRKGLQGEVEHLRERAGEARGGADVLDGLGAEDLADRNRLSATKAEDQADRLQALLDSGGEK